MAYKDETLRNNSRLVDEAHQERALRLGSLCRVYEQADRVLSGDPVTVHVVDTGPAPAWSDGQSIWINAQYIEDFDVEELTQINGLNFHELAHHLYTPRKGTELVRWVLDNNLQAAFNMLEDQRIETLLTGRYPAIAPFLTATIVRWLGNDLNSVMTNYICIRGRRYLPLDIRTQFRDLFAFPQLIPAIADIVDQYRLLAFNRDYKKAQVLIERFQREVLDPMGQQRQPGHGPSPEHMDGGPGQCGQRNPTGKGRPEPSKAQERDADRAKGIGVPEPAYVPKPAEPGDVQGYQPGDQPGDQPVDERIGCAPGGRKRDGDGDSPGGSSESNNAAPRPTELLDLTESESIERRNDAVDRTNMGAGNAHQQSVGGRPDDERIGALRDSLTQTLNDIHRNKDVIKDIRSKQRVIIGKDSKFEDNDIRPGKYSDVQPKAHVVSAFRRFAQHLERLQQECEPAWNREQPAGRVNVQRWIRGCSIDEAFDRWEEGTDGTDIEAVLLIDRSGSMCSNGNDMAASEALWVVKRSLDHIGADVSAYSFDHNAEIVYERGVKAKSTSMPFIYGNGGTSPDTALLAAERLFRSSQRKVKMMFLITDGDFGGQANEIVERINALGVMTVMVLIATDDTYKWYLDHNTDISHKCKVSRRVATAGELIGLARDVVTATIKHNSRAA